MVLCRCFFIKKVQLKLPKVMLLSIKNTGFCLNKMLSVVICLYFLDENQHIRGKVMKVPQLLNEPHWLVWDPPEPKRL